MKVLSFQKKLNEKEENAKKVINWLEDRINTMEDLNAIICDVLEEQELLIGGLKRFLEDMKRVSEVETRKE